MKVTIEKGYIENPIDPSINLIEEINKLKKEKNAVILAHFYQKDEIQDIADYIGDSLNLSQEAAKTRADIILFAGVHFMAETAKILSPGKKVLLPDLNAGCSLADSCKPADFKAFIEKHPGHVVVSYVNTTAEIKALSDVICTSSNVKGIIDSFPADQKIIFGPDRNMGNYINSITGREMVVWDGACHVHEEFSLQKILELRMKYPDAKFIAHPECRKPVLILADFIGSTSGLLKYTQTDDAQIFIVATESGILHQMRLKSPEKTFIPAPPEDATCACNDCKYMRLHTLEKVYLTLKYEMPEITISDELREKAHKSIKKMLDISETLKI